MKRVIKNLLLAFVLLSLGFVLGKELTLRSLKAQSGAAVPATTSAAGVEKVVVYYLHATARCATCSRIEKMAHAVVDRDFAEALKQGRVEWRTADSQKEEELAKRYDDVPFATVVVARLRDGKEVGFERLDDVWSLHGEPERFSAYVSAAIRAALDEEKG